jgi:hypothetical protein
MIRHNLLDSTQTSLYPRKLGNTLIPQSAIMRASYARFQIENRQASEPRFLSYIARIMQEEKERRKGAAAQECGSYRTFFFSSIYFTRKSMEHGTSTEKLYIRIIRV